MRSSGSRANEYKKKREKELSIKIIILKNKKIQLTLGAHDKCWEGNEGGR